ncbi:replication protein A 70 kDa DNA-binding subunit B [Trifolium repens]|nr:replication protein A 70 kDa DNA-binding subunit B [Trifolium repens]
MARNFEFIKDINDRKDLWKIAVKVRDKWTSQKEGKEYLELVVVDSKGDDIFVIVPNELKSKFEKEIPIVEKNTYTMQNFQVTKNQEKFKSSHHEFMLKFNGGTKVSECNKHDITDTLHFKDFTEIVCNKFREDFLYDIIAAVDEIGYTQPHVGSKKVQVNLKLKDVSDVTLNCTLWEDYATKFLNFLNGNNDSGPTIICMKYAKIKKEGKYPLTISNTWSTTKLWINDGLPEILEFKKRFVAAIDKGTISAVSNSMSQRMSQSYGGSQYSSGSQFTPEQKFYHNAEVMPLNKIVELTQETKCVTVVNCVKVKPSRNGWYYQACFQCPKQAVGDAPPYKCSDDHSTQTEILRYKLDIEVENCKVRASFVFWDRECAQLLNQSAEQLRAKMIKDGLTDPLDYPQAMDDIGGRRMAVKVKWQPNWKSGSVMAIMVDDEAIDKVQSQFLPAEMPNTQNEDLQNKEPELEEIESQDMLPDESTASVDNNVIPMLDLSATDEIGTENLEFKTPQKRLGKELRSTSRKLNAKEVDADDMIGSKLSSTKLMKIPKKE